MKVSEFAAEVYSLTARVPAGKVTTYGARARRMGRPGASRAVGAALRANPTPIAVPCHRVVRGDGGAGGIPTKAKLLKREGVKVRRGRVDLSEFLFTSL